MGLGSILPLIWISYWVFGDNLRIREIQARGKKAIGAGIDRDTMRNSCSLRGVALFWVRTACGVFDALRAKEMQDDLNLAVKLIEFFKISHGHYPISLEELRLFSS